MLSKRYRLKSSGLFRQALSGSRLFADGYFALYGLAHHQPAENPWPQFGIIISRKIDKRAARRNKIRRRLREILRTVLLPQYFESLRPYRALVIIVRRRCLEADFQTLERKLVQALTRQKPPQVTAGS